MRKTILITSVAISLLLVSTGIILNDIPCRDVATRYAPMAEAFAEGDWLYAFHPRIQPLQIVSGGIIAFLFHCNGFIALKLASALWFLAGIVVVWKLFREIYEDKWLVTAATVFYALYPDSIRMATEGLRESCKTFILLLIAYGLVKIYKNTKGYAGYIWLGCGCSLALGCRADMIMTGIFLLFTGLVLECREQKFPHLSMIPLTVTGTSIVLYSLLNYSISGHAMPDCRFAKLFLRTVNHPAGITDIIFITFVLCVLIIAGAMIMARLLRKVHACIIPVALILLMLLSSTYAGIFYSHNNIAHFIKSVIGGYGDAVGIFCLGVIIFQIWTHKLTGSEFIVGLIVLANTFFNIVPMQLFHKTLYISDRYLYTAVPLLAGFFVLGIQLIYQFIHSKQGPRPAKYILVICCACISIAFVSVAIYSPLRAYTKKKTVLVRQGILALSSAIRNDYHGEKFRVRRRMLEQYSSKRAPFVRFDENKKIIAAAYMAGGSYEPKAQNKLNYFVGNTLPSSLTSRAKKITEVDFGKYKKTVWRIEK